MKMDKAQVLASTLEAMDTQKITEQQIVDFFKSFSSTAEGKQILVCVLMHAAGLLYYNEFSRVMVSESVKSVAESVGERYYQEFNRPKAMEKVPPVDAVNTSLSCASSKVAPVTETAIVLYVAKPEAPKV